MKIYLDKLAEHLKKNKDKLSPVYLISGDEPLQLNEACDLIRKNTRQHDYTEREVFHVDAKFDWQALITSANTLSLFSDKRLLELRIPSGKPGAEGSKALIQYIEHLPEDTILLIISGKIDPQSQKSKWYTQLDKIGLTCQVWPVDSNNMPNWIAQRMKANGLNPTAEAVSLLAERVEGNLLAAHQEIQKLSLLFNKKDIDVDDVLSAVANNARYTVFELADSSLAGDIKRSSRILYGLRAEGQEPILVLWALTREIRNLCQMSADCANGHNIDSVLQKHRVWDKRKALFRQCLQSQKAPRWQNLLLKAGSIDKIIKGAETGNSWDELLQLCFQVANINPPGRKLTPG